MREWLIVLTLLLSQPLFALGDSKPFEWRDTTLSADTVLRAMASGLLLSFVNGKITGPFKLTDQRVLSDVRFENVTFTGPVEISRVTFDGRFECRTCTFKEPVQIDHSTFRNTFWIVDSTADIGFKNVVFERSCAFAGSQMTPQLEDVDFHGNADFTDVTMRGESAFFRVHFGGEAYFTRAHLRTLLFIDPTFGGLVSFQGATLTRILAFYTATFPREAVFQDIAGGPRSRLRFSSTVFRGRAFFQHTKLNQLQFNEPAPFETLGGFSVIRAVSFESRSLFRHLNVAELTCQQTEFRDYADFGDAIVRRAADFTDATFERDANFNGAFLSENLSLDHTRFLGTQNLRWPQLEERVKGEKTRATLSMLEDSFRQRGDLEGMNGAMFAGRRLDTRRSGRGMAEELFWGYGVRPLRVAGWMLLLFVLFTATYATQVGWRAAVQFSARTALHVDYGLKHAVTPIFKAMTVAESFGMKILAIFFLKALANTSPLLNDIFGRLVHF